MFLTAMIGWKAIKEGGADARRFADNFGWTAPEMNEAWTRFREPGDDFHDWKNLLTEWVRSDAQRAAKFGFDVIAWEALGMLLIWLF